MLNATTQQPVNYKALSWTVGTHILLLLVFALWKYSTPVNAMPAPEMGMEVNLGTSADGSGADQPMDMEDPADAAAVNNRRTAAQAAAADRDIERTDDADAPEVARTTPQPNTTVRNNPAPPQPRTNSANTTQPNTRAVTAPQPQKPKFVYSGSTGRGGNGAAENAPGSSEGNTTGTGDRGVPHGTPGAANYTGSPGIGTGGISHSLGGRSIIDNSAREAEFREGGKVVIRVTVNREGTIINKQIVSASNAELRPIALRKLQKVKFNSKEDAPAEQFGLITIVFKTRS